MRGQFWMEQRKLERGMEQVVAYGELEGFPEKSSLVGLCCLGKPYTTSPVSFSNGSTEATAGDFEGQKREGAMEQFLWHLTILSAGNSGQAILQGLLTRELEAGLELQHRLSRSCLHASACWMFGLRVESSGD